MLDFLLSTNPSMVQALESALRSVAVDADRPSRTFTGTWGCLAVAGTPYPGFDPVETEQHIVVVLGGPLPRYEDTVATGSRIDDGTRWILNQWKTAQRLRWDQDLVGHFAVLCIDKHRGGIDLVTDINSFVPLYRTTLAEKPRVTLVGSHVDASALAAGRVHLVDEVSAADFLMHSTVAYPYTMYHGLTQLPPASVHTVKPEGEVQSDAYWDPAEGDPPGGLTECAAVLRDTFVSNVERICAGQEAVGLLMSGGEDSRVVATVAKRTTNVRGITFVESFNREARIAELIAAKLGLAWKMVQRRPSHYLDHIRSSVRLVESHGFFIHAHSVGLLDGWSREMRLLGGHMADSWLKGHWIPRFEFAGISTAFRTPDSFTGSEQQRAVLDQQVIQRRTCYAEIVRTHRARTWCEWCKLWPASQYPDLSHFTANRRQFPVYEPFIDSLMVKLASLFPQRWKTNRRLFHAAMKPLLAETRSVPHPSGMYPYWGITFNAPLFVFKRFQNRAVSAAYRLAGRSRPNDGPWPVWSQVVVSGAFDQVMRSVTEAEYVSLFPALGARLIELAEAGSPTDRLRALHLLHWAHWSSTQS